MPELAPVMTIRNGGARRVAAAVAPASTRIALGRGRVVRRPANTSANTRTVVAAALVTFLGVSARVAGAVLLSIGSAISTNDVPPAMALTSASAWKPKPYVPTAILRR